MQNKQTGHGWNFDNSYSRLPDELFARVQPVPVKSPQLVLFNEDLATQLGLSRDVAGAYSGNVLPDGSEPIAQAYAGHQFGHFTKLGDGRAHLLGEQIVPTGERYDVQLKGSGPTPFSRRGDGRAALGPMLREYIVSEAMHALGIPTTRSLAVATTGEPVFRERPLPGAVLTRVASSHIRVGTFEYAAAFTTPQTLRALADYTIRRHYPELGSYDEPYLALLKTAVDRQAALIAQWMHVGFIHGVMNTDNMALSGETIDYGPCAFMDQYSPSTVFSSIDTHGRYAYGNQPQMAMWNLARFAETLLPLLSSDEDQAAQKAVDAIEAFAPKFQNYWLSGFCRKLGLEPDHADDAALIGSLLDLMEKHKADFTATFVALSREFSPDNELFRAGEFTEWLSRWRARQPDLSLMRTVNPLVIPRNHRVEEALAAAVDQEDYSVLNRLLGALKSPYDWSENADWLSSPSPGTAPYQTFCGT